MATMMSAARWLLAVALLACLGSPTAYAKEKRAFVVGIDIYDNLAPDRQLKRAVGDAAAMRQALETLGFQVLLESNVNRTSFNKRWQDFLKTVQKGDDVAVFFSGHGFEINGANFLVPRDVPRVKWGRAEELKRESISLQELINDLQEVEPAFTLMVIDACRQNPFLEGEKLTIARGGLAQVEAPDAIFIMYSAGARQIALDHLPDNDNFTTSVYVRALVPLMTTPGLSLLDLADQVSQHVRDITASVWHRQTPTFYSGVAGARNICLAGCSVVAARPPTEPKPQAPPPPPSGPSAGQPADPAAGRPFAGEWLVTTRWTSGCTNPGRSMKIAIAPSGRISEGWVVDEKGRVGQSITRNIRAGSVSETGRLVMRYTVVPRVRAPAHVNILEGDIRKGSGRARSERDGKTIGCPGFFSITALPANLPTEVKPETKRSSVEPKPPGNGGKRGRRPLAIRGAQSGVGRMNVPSGWASNAEFRQPPWGPA